MVSGCLVWKSRHRGSVRLRFPAGVITVSSEGSRAEKGKLPQWLLLAIAISLLLQSSFAVLEVGMLLLVFCCVYYRRQLLEKDGWLTLGKAAAATLLGNLWYLLPMLRYLVAYRDVARYVGSRPFQEKGAFLLHYLTFFFQGGATYDYKSKGFQGTAAIGVGPALTGLFFSCCG